ncbi:MAG TPA: magnesium transporter [Candidatus Gastranaerophilales bacterium]|nr:magnesium transporter [Candidatus Gastranaerophilales bacterium]
MIEEHIIEKLKGYVELENEAELQNELNNMHSADIAEVFEQITPDEREKYFGYLDAENAAYLLEEVSPQLQVELLGNLEEEKAAEIVSKMSPDLMADFLGDLSDEEVSGYLNKLPQRVSTQIRELMTYPEDSAGGIMTTEFLRVNENITVEETFAYVRTKATSNIDFYYIYVVDKLNHLLGVLSLRSLISSPLDMQVGNIMTADVFKVHTSDDQEYVADSIIKYGYLALPVVDNYNRLKGIVTWDDAHYVNEEETTEEIYASSGISTAIFDEDEILTGKLMLAVRARAPWLLITLFGEFIAVNVANHFDGTLRQLPVIAIFIPLLAGLGGNIGTQSVTLMVRGLSTGQITMNSALHHVFRELRIGLIIGLTFGLLVMVVTWNWKNNIVLGSVVGISMAANMTIATLLGGVSPFLLKKLKFDPAVASGPFIATAIDVIGLAVYFILVTLSLKFLI